MASRFISAILWTLVSVNVITLVVGGLITWLGYAIPARLKQFGLLPGLVIVAGFASLIVACIGLCALNYSSHHALNIYGFSCTVFVMMLVFGIPETWYKSHQFGEGGLLMDIIYFSLVILLLILLVFAFTFAQHLRRKESAQQSRAHPDCWCNRPNCSCSQHYPPLDATDRDPSRNSSSYIDKWLPLINNQHNNRNNLDEMNLASRNNCSCHLSDCPSPSQHQAPAGGAPNQSGRCNVRSNNNNNFHKPHNSLPLATSNPQPPLVHRGFYQNSANNSGSGLVRAKSYNQPLNGQQLHNDFHEKAHHQPLGRDFDCRWSRIYRSRSSNQCLTQPSIDDSLVQYGHSTQFQQHHQLPVSSNFPTLDRHHYYHHDHTQNQNGQMSRNQFSVSKCNCHLGNGLNSAESRQRSTTTSPAYRKYLYNEMASSTMPRLGSSSAYATRVKPKFRTKGSSSVVAMTAAAAAALLGGVADTCSAMPTENDGGLFTDAGDGIAGGDGGGDADVSLLGGCILDNNELNVSMLNGHSTSSIHWNGCRQPVLDFTPLLDFRKT